MDGGQRCRNEDDEDDEGYDATRKPHSLGRKVLVLAETQQAHAAPRGKGDKDGVNEEQVKGAEKEMQVARRQSEARRTEGRHEGGGNGDARYDVALAVRADGNDARRTAAEGNEHVVERGRGARQQLALHLREGREQEVDRRCEDADERGNAVVLRRTAKQRQVVGAQRKAYAEDGTHEGRDEHGTDNDGR